MKIILVFVSTLDGKITKWGNPNVRSWSSQSDKDYFNKIWKSSRLIISGSNSFNVEPIKASPHHLLMVMTKYPRKYKRYEVPGQLEFTDLSPVQLVERFTKEGFESMLVVGGAKVATSFLRDQLVDELWLTIEPKIFGKGDAIVTEGKFDINLRLINCEKVNEQGTLITKYEVLKG